MISCDILALLSFNSVLTPCFCSCRKTEQRKGGEKLEKGLGSTWRLNGRDEGELGTAQEEKGAPDTFILSTHVLWCSDCEEFFSNVSKPLQSFLSTQYTKFSPVFSPFSSLLLLPLFNPVFSLTWPLLTLDRALLSLSVWRRQWKPTPVFLPGESQGQRSLVGCRLSGRTESDTTGLT